MSNNIFSIGLSGLAAANWGLTTALNNISNASTPGYSVEHTVYQESSGQYTGSGYMGSGVTTTTVQRSYSQYLTTALNNATAANSALSANYDMASQLNNLVGSPTAGISAAITAYFTGLQSVANSPSSLASRQSALGSAQTLASQINAAGSQYAQLRSSVNDQLTTAVNQINGYTKQIADLNLQIADASGQGQPPNQLLDQRDQIVANLSGLVGVSVVQNSNGYNVFLGSGQPLVVANQNFALGAQVSSGDPSELSVTYNGIPGSTGTPASLSSAALAGGTVGGLLTFRSQTLDPAQAQLGAIASSFASQVNAQNALGTDLSGNAGGALFTVGSPIVYSNLKNTGGAALSVSFANPAQPTSGDYALSFDGATYTLTNTSTGSVVATSASAPSNTTMGGLVLNITGTMNAGDSFTIQPTRGALDTFGLANTSPSAIAASSPVLASAPSTNIGAAAISQGTVTAGYNVPSTPTTLTFDSVAGTLSGWPVGSKVSVNGGTPVPITAATTTIPYAPGNSYTITTTPVTATSLNAVSFTMTGIPANGDKFTIARNAGLADGRNALALSKLVSSGTAGNGTVTFTGAYANYVNTIGNAAGQLKSASTAQSALVSQISAAQQSVSGVNLDEEAASLLKYQQLYQANSKAIQTAQSMFQTLMGIFS